MRYLYFVLLLCNLQPALADFQMTPTLEEAYLNFLALKVDKASQQAQNELLTNPHNGVAIYLMNYGDLIRLLVTEDKELYALLAPNENLRLEAISQLEKASPYYLFAQAEVKLQWAFIKLKFGEELSAAWNIRLAYKLLVENQEKFPNFLPHKKSLGLLHLLIGSVPEKYTWVVSIVGMKGTIAEGLQELQTVLERNLPYKMEAALLLNMIHTYILKSGKEGLASFEKLCMAYPDNLLANFVYASAAIKEGMSDMVLQVLENRPAGKDYLSFYLIEYRKAEIYLQKGEYKKALELNTCFLAHFKGQNFIKDTYYKLFLIHWLQGKDAEANTWLNKVLKTGQAVAEADKYAQKFAEAGILPHKDLMKSRLAFDGGYYQQAADVLKGFSETSFTYLKDKAEFNYRLGRIAQKTGHIQAAMKLYLLLSS